MDRRERGVGKPWKWVESMMNVGPGCVGRAELKVGRRRSLGFMAREAGHAAGMGNVWDLELQFAQSIYRIYCHELRK